MKKNLLSLLLLLFTFSVFSQQYIVNFKVKDKKEAYKLPEYVQVDGYKKNIVTAYIYGKNFEKFKQLGYNFELLPHPGKGKALTMATTVAEMANWDRYPTFEVLNQMIDQFATDYPNICRVETMGTSEDGREIKVIKITDNPDLNEEEPEFYYTGQMHGDEIVAYIMFLRLADHLLSNYGTDPRITNLINNTEIWINPLSNPDGTYTNDNLTVSGATRSNGNGVDLNRNFPSPNDPNPSGQNEAEVQMQIAFAQAHHLVMSANSHSGIELINYPWDSWTSSHPNADQDWWEHISYNYADTVHTNSPSSYFQGEGGGVTHGGDWYIVDGSRQDNMCYFQHCRELTLELSNNKMLDANLLPAHWNYNKSAMIGYIEECLYGFNGTVKNTNGDPLNAKIEISGHDVDNSEVYTDPTKGDYHRPISPGTYDVTYSSFGYTSQNYSITVNAYETTNIKNVFLGISPTAYTLYGSVIEDGSSNLLENVKIELVNIPTSAVYSIANGTYTKEAIENGTYLVKASKEGYLSETSSVTISGNDVTLNFILKPNVTITGTITEDGSGTPLENVKIEVLNSSIPFILTNSAGQYSINNVPQTNQQIKASKTGYTAVIKNVDISTTTTVDFTIAISNAISFESEIPSFFTFEGNANWTRVTPEAYDGTYSMKSGDILDNQSTVLQTQLNITSAGNISFYKKVSSESGYDKLIFYIDDIEQDRWSGNVNWSQESFAVTTGIHTFKWVYSKDSGYSFGSDCAWVDYIEFPEYQELASYTVTGTVTDQDSGAPIEGATISITNTSFTTQTIANGTYSLTGVTEGTYEIKATATNYSTILQNISVSDTNHDNINFALEISDAINFEIDIPSDFTFSGNQDWTRVNDKSYNGTWSMKSGSIGNNESSIMELTKNTEAGNISFYKFVSSEDGSNWYDYLKFSIDGIEKGKWKGIDTEWTEATYPVLAGTHTYTWEYLKDGSANGGDDCAWVDYIDFPATAVGIKNNISDNNKFKISPNPFNQTTSFEFYITNSSNVFIGIYSYNGKLVKTLMNNKVDSGNHRVIWDGTNQSKQKLANGLYFCKIINEENSKTEKVILLR